MPISKTMADRIMNRVDKMACKTITIDEIAPTLEVTDIVVEPSSSANDPSNNEYGVYLEIHISGSGVGNLKIKWGNLIVGHDEIKTGLREGNYAYVSSLPHGTHEICVELFNIKH